MGGMIDAENVFHPLYPDYLYLSFWHGTGKLGLNHAERLIIVPLFSRYVTDRLGIILADANDMLLSRVEYENV
jgi:hypothetical protein